MGRSNREGSALRSEWPQRRSQLASQVASLSVAALVLASCVGGNTPAVTGSGTTGGTEVSTPGTTSEPDVVEPSKSLVIAYPQEPPDWNYVQGSATAMRVLLMYNVVEPLLEKMEDGSFEPLLTDSLDISEDGLEYNFNLREAKFHDGSELSADDVIYSLELNRTSEFGTVIAAFEALDRIEKVDERTVRVTLSRPSQRFLDGMSGDAGLIIPDGSAEGLSQRPIGTGPFVFGEWRPDVQVSLSRFDDYWGDQPYFEDVTWRFITDETASLNALLAGEVDIVAGVLGEGINRVASIDATDGFAIATTVGSQITYLALNASLEKFEDERIRQAIAHALDRQPIIDAAFAGLGEPTCVFVNPPEVPWDSDYCPYPYDPDLSRQLLADAGVEGFGLEFKHLTVSEFPTIMEVVTAQLTEVGIAVETAPRELATYFDEITAAEPDYELTSLSGASQIDGWICPGIWLQLCDPAFDDLINQADASLSSEEWANLRREAVERHADWAYLIPLGNKHDIMAYRDAVGGVKPYRAQNEFDLRNLEWTD